MCVFLCVCVFVSVCDYSEVFSFLEEGLADTQEGHVKEGRAAACPPQDSLLYFSSNWKQNGLLTKHCLVKKRLNNVCAPLYAHIDQEGLKTSVLFLWLTW